MVAVERARRGEEDIDTNDGASGTRGWLHLPTPRCVGCASGHPGNVKVWWHCMSRGGARTVRVRDVSPGGGAQRDIDFNERPEEVNCHIRKVHTRRGSYRRWEK